ncbi:unnamed protein product [Brassica oleracea]
MILNHFVKKQVPTMRCVNNRVSKTMVKIYCIGGGYVGGPTIAVIALKCPHMYIVGVVDISVLPINAWNSDQVPHLRAWP